LPLFRKIYPTEGDYRDDPYIQCSFGFEDHMCGIKDFMCDMSYSFSCSKFMGKDYKQIDGRVGLTNEVKMGTSAPWVGPFVLNAFYFCLKKIK